MEAGRSLASLFPVSQSPIVLPRSQQALRKQEQMRKKEIQLQNQLQSICQRQHDAHRRNQALLRDFSRIEQELSLLTAKSDSFRQKQEKYKKQAYPFISEQIKYAASNNNTSTRRQSCIKQFNVFPVANYGDLCEPCHFSASVGHVVQPPTHFSLGRNQQLGLQGCCNNSLCCGLVHPYCDGQFGSFLPDACKILASTLDSQSQNKKCPASDSSIPMFIPNSKRGIVQHCPGFVCDKDSSLKCRAMSTHIHGDLLQCILSSDMYSDWKEKLLKEVQQQMVGEYAVETTVEQSKEDDDNKWQAYHGGSPKTVSDYPLKHSDALSHLPSVSTPERDHNLRSASKRSKCKQLKTVNGSISYEVTAQQNIDEGLCKEHATSKVNSQEIKLSLKLSGAPDSLVGTEVKEQTNNYKANDHNDMGNDGCKEEIKTVDFSEEESVCEEAIGHPDQKYLGPAASPHQYKNEKCTSFLATYLKKSLEEFLDSSEEENILQQASKKFHIVQENENSSSCRASEDGFSQEEASISSHSSAKQNRSNDSICSAKKKRLEMEEQREMVQLNRSVYAGNSFAINTDKMKGKMDMSEEESDSSDNDGSQMWVIKCDDGNLGMLKGDCRFSSPNFSANNKTGDIYGEDGERERFREMLTEDIEKSSSEVDQESEDRSKAESLVHEGICIFTVKEKNTQRSDKVNVESEIEDAEGDRTSEEDKISIDDSQGSSIGMDKVIHGITKEEQYTDGDKENKLTKKKGNQAECNTGNNIISEEAMSDKANISDEETLSSEDLDVSDEIDSSEEEVNTDFWGSRHEENDSDIEEMEKEVQLQSSKSEGSNKQVNVDVSAREEGPREPAASVVDVAAASCQLLVEDEEVNSEKQSERPQGKRCSEDGSMDMLQLHPVEFGSSLPAEEPFAGSITNDHTEDASAAETNAEDSDEESLLGEKESEKSKQQWSDSEDNVHSFYD